MPAHEEIIFKGKFDLNEALLQFGDFTNKLINQLGKVQRDIVFGGEGDKQQRSKTKRRVAELQKELEAELKQVAQRIGSLTQRSQKAGEAGVLDPAVVSARINALADKYRTYERVLERIRIKQEEGQKVTFGDIRALRQLEKELQQLTRQLDATGKAIDKQANQGFANKQIQNRAKTLYGELVREVELAKNKIVASQDRINEAIERRLVDPSRGQSGLNRLTQQYQSYAAVLDRIHQKQREGIPLTNQDIVALHSLRRTLNNLDGSLLGTEKQIAQTYNSMRTGSRELKEFTRSAVIAGFSLQQLGGFLYYNLTLPLIRVGQAIFNAGLDFEAFEKRLAQVAGFTQSEVQRVLQTTKEVAKSPNLDLQDTIQFFDKLIIVAGKTADELEILGKGFATALEGVEPSEKRGLVGQLLDVFGSGELPAGIERTLVGAPRLSKAINEILGEPVSKSALERSNLTALELFTKAFEKLANEPIADTARNKIKNLRDEFVFLGRRIAKVYEDDLRGFLDFIEKRILPALDKLLTAFEKSPALQNFSLALYGITVAAAPLIFSFATLGLVAVGLTGFIQQASLYLALFTNNAVATTIATKGLAGLITAQTGTSGAFGSLLTLLPRVLGFFNPITLAITAISGLIAYLIAKDLGGLRTSLTDLAQNTISQVIDKLNILTRSFELVSIAIQGFLGFLDKFQGTGVLGVILSFFVDLGNLITTLVNTPFKLLSDAIQYLIDLTEVGFPIAAEKFKLSFLKAMKEIIDIFPEFIQNWIGLDEKIKETQNLLDKMSGSTKAVENNYRSLASKVENAARNQKELAKSLEDVTKALEDQNKRLQDNIAKQREANIEARNRIFQETQKRIGDRSRTNIDQFDLTRPEEQQRALQAAENEGKRAVSIAAADQRTELRKRFNEALEQARTDIKRFQDSLEPKMKELTYTLFTDVDNAILNSVNTGSINTNIFNTLIRTFSQRLNRDRRFANQSKQFAGALSQITKNIEISIAQATKVNSSEAEIVRLAQDDLKQDVQEKIVRTQQEQVKKDTASSYENLIEEYRREIELIERRKELAQEEFNITGDLKNYLAAILKANDDIFDYELKIIETETRIAIEQAESEGDRERIRENANKRIQNLRDWRDADKKAGVPTKEILKDIVDRERDTKEGLEDILREVNESNLAYQDLLISLASFGLDVNSRLQAAQNRFKIFTSGLIQKDFDKLKISAQSLTEITNNFPQVGEFLEKKFKFDNPEQIQGFIKEAESLLVFLQDFDALNLSEKSSAQVILVIENLIKALGTARKSVSQVEKDQISLAERRGNIRLAELEYQKRLNDDIQKELELTKQIAELRQKRGSLPDIKGLSDFARNVFDILTGNRKAIYELEKKSLENQKEQAKLELEIALARLEIEKEIAKIRIDASDLPPEEKEKRKKQIDEQFERLKENLRKQGDLQKQVIDEQINSLNQFGGTFGEIIFQGISKAFGALFGKKKKGDEVQVIGDDETQATADNAQEQLGWLDKLSGGLKTYANLVFAVGDAIASVSEFSLKAIARALKEELYALSKKFLIKSLEFAAIALGALVFGDFGTAARAGAAAAAYGLAAAAAGAAGGAIGLLDGTDQSNAQATSDRNAGAQTGTFDEAKDKEIQRQREWSVNINFDVRQDEGILIKKEIKWQNTNTDMTTLTNNNQIGFRFPPRP